MYYIGTIPIQTFLGHVIVSGHQIIRYILLSYNYNSHFQLKPEVMRFGG
jgi:hypothetical protein